MKMASALYLWKQESFNKQKSENSVAKIAKSKTAEKVSYENIERVAEEANDGRDNKKDVNDVKRSFFKKLLDFTLETPSAIKAILAVTVLLVSIPFTALSINSAVQGKSVVSQAGCYVLSTMAGFKYGESGVPQVDFIAQDFYDSLKLWEGVVQDNPPLSNIDPTTSAPSTPAPPTDIPSTNQASTDTPTINTLSVPANFIKHADSVTFTNLIRTRFHEDSSPTIVDDSSIDLSLIGKQSLLIEGLFQQNAILSNRDKLLEVVNSLLKLLGDHRNIFPGIESQGPSPYAPTHMCLFCQVSSSPNKYSSVLGDLGSFQEFVSRLREKLPAVNSNISIGTLQLLRDHLLNDTIMNRTLLTFSLAAEEQNVTSEFVEDISGLFDNVFQQINVTLQLIDAGIILAVSLLTFQLCVALLSFAGLVLYYRYYNISVLTPSPNNFLLIFKLILVFLPLSLIIVSLQLVATIAFAEWMLFWSSTVFTSQGIVNYRGILNLGETDATTLGSSCFQMHTANVERTSIRELQTSHSSDLVTASAYSQQWQDSYNLLSQLIDKASNEHTNLSGYLFALPEGLLENMSGWEGDPNIVELWKKIIGSTTEANSIDVNSVILPGLNDVADAFNIAIGSPKERKFTFFSGTTNDADIVIAPHGMLNARFHPNHFFTWMKKPMAFATWTETLLNPRGILMSCDLTDQANLDCSVNQFFETISKLMEKAQTFGHDILKQQEHFIYFLNQHKTSGAKARLLQSTLSCDFLIIGLRRDVTNRVEIYVKRFTVSLLWWLGTSTCCLMALVILHYLNGEMLAQSNKSITAVCHLKSRSAEKRTVARRLARHLNKLLEAKERDSSRDES
eukprot:GHVL01021659.1.p1 GENE.GHVL01021659.1~~GHVL01021659.1.p1  ORF type:complete len:846 (-),score=97.93 GHVL01021659.1:1561-4098(-)